ncbi:UNVERIFIED_ORG: hypothetical protein J2X74_000250 [Bacillus sp. 1751]|nr:hypothetical protein [Bacillus sp. 1751]
MKKLMVGMVLFIFSVVAGCSSGDSSKEVNSSGVQAESSSKDKDAKGRQIVIDDMKDKIPAQYKKQRMMDIKNKDLYSIKDDGTVAALGVSLNESLSDVEKRWGEPDHISQKAPGDQNHFSDKTTYYLPGKGDVEVYWVRFWTWDNMEFADAINDIEVITIYKNGILPNLLIPNDFSRKFHGDIYKLHSFSAFNLDFQYLDDGMQDGKQVVNVYDNEIGGKSSPEAKSVPALQVHLNIQDSVQRKRTSADEELTMDQAVKFAEDRQKDWEEEQNEIDSKKQ